MKSFKQLREELSPGFVSQFKSSVNKPRRPYRNVGGRITKYYDPENDGKNDLPEGVKATFYAQNDEKKMIEDAFKTISDYPFVITFNGDDFDMPYFFFCKDKY